MEGEALDVHNIVNDFKDLYHKYVNLVVYCHVVLLVSALLVIGPLISPFPTTTPLANAHPITVPPISALLALPLFAFPFLTIDLAIATTNDSCVIIDDEYVPHKVLSKSRFLEINEKELDNVNKGGCNANKHSKVWAKNAFDVKQKFEDIT